jgi:hypothetical protein
VSGTATVISGADLDEAYEAWLDEPSDNGDGPHLATTQEIWDLHQNGEDHRLCSTCLTVDGHMDGCRRDPNNPHVLAVRSVRDTLADPPAEPEPLAAGLINQDDRIVMGAGRAWNKSIFIAQLGLKLAEGRRSLPARLPRQTSLPRPDRARRSHPTPIVRAVVDAHQR